LLEVLWWSGDGHQEGDEIHIVLEGRMAHFTSLRFHTIDYYKDIYSFVYAALPISVKL
jgi:hypothetical protein